MTMRLNKNAADHSLKRKKNRFPRRSEIVCVGAEGK